MPWLLPAHHLPAGGDAVSPGDRRGSPAGGAPDRASPAFYRSSTKAPCSICRSRAHTSGKRSEHLVVSLERQEINRIPLAAVRQVVLFGNVQISTQALETLVQQEVPVALLTRYGRFIGALTPAPSKNVMLRVNQYRAFSDPAKSLALSKAVVKAKIANQRVLLMRSLRAKGPDDEEPVRGSDDPAAEEMARMLARVDDVPDDRHPAGAGRSGGQRLFRGLWAHVAQPQSLVGALTSGHATGGRHATR